MENKPFSDNFAFVDTLLESLLFECLIRYKDHNNDNNNSSNAANTAQKFTHSTPDSSYQTRKDDTTTTTPATIQFHPLVLCMQLGSVARFCREVSVKSVHKLNGQVIFDLGLNTVSGLMAQLNDRIPASPRPGEEGDGRRTNDSSGRGGGDVSRRFKFIPESVTSLIDLAHPESSMRLCDKISFPVEPLSDQVIEAYRAAFKSKVPEETRKEIVFLLEMLDRNGLFAIGQEGARIAEDAEEYGGYGSEGDMYKPFAELYIERQIEDATFCGISAKISDLADSIETLTSLKALILSSSDDAINISDYHVEILLVNPISNLPRTLPLYIVAKMQDADNPTAPTTVTSSAGNHDEPPAMTMPELITLLESAGYESIYLESRYSSTFCNINPQYVGFFDPTTGLTCQISLDNPIGLRLRDMMHAYYDSDNYVEEFISGLQLTLDMHGRSRMYLSNYAVALMAIEFLVTNGFLHKVVVRNHSQQQPEQQPEAQPQEIQQAQQPSTSTSTSTIQGATLSKSQKKKAKRKLRAQQKKRLAEEEARARKDFVEVKTISGTTRTINCAFEKQPIEDQKYLEDNMGDTLVEFCHYYAFQQEKWMRSGVGAAEEAEICDRGVAGGPAEALKIIGKNQSSGREYAKLVGKNTRRGKQYRRPRRDSDDSSEEGWSNESDDDGNQSSSDSNDDSDHPIFRPPGVIMNTDDRGWGRLVVQDPFVPERNVTPFCNGWRLRHVCRVFERAYLTLMDEADKYDEDQDMDEEWGHTLELDAFHDATSRGTPKGLAQLMRDIHDPIFG